MYYLCVRYGLIDYRRRRNQDSVRYKILVSEGDEDIFQRALSQKELIDATLGRCLGTIQCLEHLLEIEVFPRKIDVERLGLLCGQNGLGMETFFDESHGLFDVFSPM